MHRRIYFGNILAEIADQNSQGRFQNTEPTDCQVYKSGRQSIFSCKAGKGYFEYRLSTGEHVFTLEPGPDPELLHAGWDGLSHGQQLEFVSSLYTFMLRNRMTNASKDEFVTALCKSPG